MWKAATRMECPTATVALFAPRRPFSRWYWADRYVPLDLAAARADSVSAERSHFDPLRVLPERCLPADSLLPGHIPAHEARRAEDPNLPMSTPISAIISSAVRCWTPGMLRSISTASPKRGDHLLDLRRQVPDGLVQELQVGKDRAHDEGVMGSEPPGQGLLQLGDLLAKDPPGELGEDLGVPRPRHQGGKHVPAGGAQDVGGDRGQL